MQKIILSLIISALFAEITIAQNNQTVIQHPKGNHLKGTINLKIFPQYRNYFETLKNNIEGFEHLGITAIRRKFPTRKPPVNEFHENGIKIPDLSLIYELDYNTETDAFTVSAQLMKSRLFEYAEPNFVSYPLYTPNDAMLPVNNPYHFVTMQLYNAWDVEKGDTNVVIGYTDTSFDINHPDMSENIKYNYADPANSLDDDNDGYIDNYAGWDLADNDNGLFINNEIHGTTVAAIGSATGDNNTGYLGSGFKCKFIPVKVANSSQVITKGYEGIVYCIDKGAKIINCSWGNTTFNSLAQDVTDAAILGDDAVIVASAGNIPYDTAYYPASYRYVLSVTGVDSQDRYDPPSLNPFSRNDSVDVSAPGFSVYTTATYNGTPLYSPPQGGTSLAAPLVAGVAALIRSHFPSLNALQVAERIKCTADNIDGIPENIPYAGKIGTGRVNAYTALTSILCGTVALEDESHKQNISLYPNPTSETITLAVKTPINLQTQITVYNTLGKQVFASENLNFTKENTIQTLDVSRLAAGIYFVKIESEKNLTIEKINIAR